MEVPMGHLPGRLVDIVEAGVAEWYEVASHHAGADDKQLMALFTELSMGVLHKMLAECKKENK